MIDKEKYLQIIASFLIALVFSIPFNVSIVFAAINRISVKGSNGIEGFAKSNDFLNFNVQASIANNTITKDQIFLGSDIKFDSCSQLPSNAFECALKFPGTGTSSFESKPLPFTINLYNDSSKQKLDDSKSGSVIIDNRAPQLKLTVSKNKYSGQENVVVNYEATDFACNDQSCTGKCVGIKKVDLLIDKSSKSIAPNTTNCNFKSNISFDAKTLKDGENTVTAKAIDNFDQASQEISAAFTVDASPPIILANSFAIIRKGISLSTFSPNSVPVEVTVNISASDLNANSVTANLSALNPSLKYVKASCTPVGNDLNICRWPIDLNPGTSGTKAILINASDLVGNKASITISKALALDDKGPVVLSLSTSTTKDDKVFAKPAGSTVTASFNELTGLSADEVFLHIDNSKKAAASCDKEANWLCKWNNVEFGSSAKASISIGSDTNDILRNSVSEAKIIEVIIDGKPPVVTGISLSSVGTISETNPDLFKIGDKIFVEANVTEENDLTAIADFSKFIKNAKRVAGSCKILQEDKQVCSFLTDAITTQASDVAAFNFTDIVGNQVLIAKPLQTLGLEEAKTPDFWKSTTDCSPKAVDRQLGPLINQRVYCNVKLEPLSASALPKTVFIDQASCTGNGKNLVQNIETFNRETGSTSPIIKITFKKDEFKINEANLSCSLAIISRVGDKITKNPELETANISIKFYNLPLGEVSDNVQKKIDDAKKEINKFWKLIGTMNKVVFYSKKICQVFGIIYNVVAVYYSITAYTKTAEDTCFYIPIGGLVCLPPLHAASTALCFGQQASETAADSAWVTGGKFCKFVNCQWAPGVVGKYQQFITDQINKIPGSEWLPGPGRGNLPGTGAQQLAAGGTRGGIAGYLDPNNNLLTASLFLCVPGIISGLDKYRQIKCLYVDCLQNAVAKDGLPITACEEQKSYATCKYIYGEVFAVVPYTAVFDHFAGIIKEALSNPFAAVGAIVGAICYFTCPQPPPGAGPAYIACEGVRLASKFGEVLQNIKGLYKEGFKIRQDYCSRLDLEEKKEEKKEEEKK